MKKFLSLVLALVMTMSLVTISAGAKDFTDGDKINYAEAIDVVSAIGIVDGYADGSFNPQATLTRGAAAKIICNLILGPTTAASLKADAAPFKDVAVDNNFAGYIAYCSNAGIINGYADGTFKPGNTLTGYAFMKMLLGALGYDAKIEGFVGNNWSIQVAKTALGIGLDKGLVDSFNGLKAVTREEACLFAFNTVKADLVEYKNPGSTITVGGVEVVTNAGKATSVEWSLTTIGQNTDGNIDTKGGDGFVQFGEKYFTKLVRDGADEAFSRPAHLWSYKGDKIGSYVDTPTASYVGKVKFADIYADCKLTSTTDEFVVYVDGVYAEDYDMDFDDIDDIKAADLKKASTITVKSGDEDTKVGTGEGCIVEVYKSGTKDVPGVISIINTYVGQVIGVEKASGKTKASVDVGPVGTNYAATTVTDCTNNVLDNETFETEAFEVDDVVVFNYSRKGTSGGAIKDMTKAEVVTGELTKIASGSKCTVAGETYKYGEFAANKFGSAQVNTEVTLYLDANGKAMYFKEGSENLKNYALVLDAGKTSVVGGSSYEAELLYADGTTAVVKTDKAYGQTNGASLEAASDEMVGEWVLYKTNAKGKVVLTRPVGTNVSVYATWGGSSYSVDTTSTYAIPVSTTKNTISLDDATVKINSDTTIVVKDKANNYRVYNGVKEMPEVVARANISYSVYTKSNSTYAKLVYIDTDGNLKDTSNKTIMILSKKDADYWDDGEKVYYTFDAVVDGKIVEDGIMLDYSEQYTKAAIDTVLATTKNTALTLNTYSIDNGVYSINMADTVAIGNDDGAVVASGKGIEKVTGTSIDFEVEGTYTLADNCVFYRVNTHGDLEQTTKSALRTSTVGTYYAYLSFTLNRDAEITGVYWIVK